LWTWWVGDPPLECLAKFGYRSDGEVKKFGIPPLIWRLVETYSLNLVTLFIYFLTPNVVTWACFLFPLCLSHLFFFFFWPGCETFVKNKKKNIAYDLCLTQNNSQKALQKKRKMKY
jgi:hypothetical protein